MPNIIAGVVLPPFSSRILELPKSYEVEGVNPLRVGPHSAKCPRYFINPKVRDEEANKHPHNWGPFTACFPHNSFHGGNMAVSKEDAAMIPNWSWCNKCGALDTERPICEKHVFTDRVGGHRCDSKGVNYEQEFRNWMVEKDDPGGVNENPYRWWCKLHTPSLIAEKKDAKALIRAAESAAYQRNRDRAKEKEDARNALVELALETMKWLEESGLKDDDEWGRTLHKRIAAAKDKL